MRKKICEYILHPTSVLFYSPAYQVKKLLILLSVYFHEVLQKLNTFIFTNFQLERVLIRFEVVDT